MAAAAAEAAEVVVRCRPFVPCPTSVGAWRLLPSASASFPHHAAPSMAGSAESTASPCATPDTVVRRTCTSASTAARRALLISPAAMNRFSLRSSPSTLSSPTSKGVPPSCPTALASEAKDMGWFAAGVSAAAVTAVPSRPCASTTRMRSGAPRPALETRTVTASRLRGVSPSMPSGIILRRRDSNSGSLLRHTRSPGAGCLAFPLAF
mmetsp:Transcript_35812/g.89390  ORF Transcript_35812/g.89390 Transcript_35812/m.89390 type:complete len:208 (+) Transcript_35812:1248-1871(+)